MLCKSLKNLSQITSLKYGMTMATRGFQDNLAGPGIGNYEELETILPTNYKPLLSRKNTQIAVKKCKDFIENGLEDKLGLIRVECPLIVDAKRGVNDMLDRDGSRTPVNFHIKNDNGKNPIDAEVVQAATKWKRLAIKEYELTNNGEGLYTDMRAVRKDYFLDHDHSCYVAQWDWEQTMNESQRNLDFLFGTVNKLWDIIKECEDMILNEFNELHQNIPKEERLPNKLLFLHCEELFDRYKNNPNVQGRKERESAILKENKAVFLCGIGYPLDTPDKLPHELRAADYDDWVTIDKWPLDGPYKGKELHGLNGDILTWNHVTQRRHELSSMGIRVTKDTLREQLEMTHQLDHLKLPYHQAILNDLVPLTIGGGIGQSRVFGLLLRKAALGEIEVSAYPEKFIQLCKDKNIHILQ